MNLLESAFVFLETDFRQLDDRLFCQKFDMLEESCFACTGVAGDANDFACIELKAGDDERLMKNYFKS